MQLTFMTRGEVFAELQFLQLNSFVSLPTRVCLFGLFFFFFFLGGGGGGGRVLFCGPGNFMYI